MKQLNDKQLLDETAALAKAERQTTAKVIEYLNEIDRRRLWEKEGYSSLFDFCVRYLNYSEDEAGRRIHVARCVQKVEAVKPMLESNSLSLTGLSLIASHLTRENAATLLPEVERKSCSQIREVLRHHFPEASLPEEVLKIVLDDELKTLLADAQRELSEKDQKTVLKRVLRRFLARKRERKSKVLAHTRYVPAAIRREVKARDGHRCSYRSKSGMQCNQTAHLQIDHVRPWAKGGSSLDPGNLRVLCRVHNLMLGREAFPQHVSKHVHEIEKSIGHRPVGFRALGGAEELLRQG